MGDLRRSLENPWYVKDHLPSGWIRVDFQPRDVRLLRILLEQKFLSREQIAKHFFNGKTQYAYMRVWKLRRFGFIRRYLPGFTNHDLYLATEAAHDFFRDQFVTAPAPFTIPDIRTISHDLLVTDVRFLFETIGFGSSWTSERMWRTGRSVRLWAPDAIIHIGRDPFALEIECAQKMDRRYDDIFSRYQSDPEIVACLYITTENLIHTLMERAKSYPRIYFATVTEVFEQKEKTLFRNSTDRVIAIEDNLESRLNQVPIDEQH